MATQRKTPADKKAPAVGGKAVTATSARAWKRAKATEELELPSGNVALVKRPGPALLLQEGFLPDSLSMIVNETIRENKGMKPQDLSEIQNDPDKIVDMLEGIDRMIPMIVVEPPTLFHKTQVLDDEGNPVTKDNGQSKFEDIPGEDRDDDYVYTDDIELDDKMFLFQFAVGGTRSYEQFREEQRVAMGDVPSS